MKSLIINADDFGLTNSVSIDILKLFDKNLLNGTSVIVNGLASEKILINLKDFNSENLKLHLNLLEFKPLSNFELYDFIDEKKNFNNNFIKILSSYFFSNEKKKKEIITCFKKEITLQIEKFKDIYGLDKINLDSHQHLHYLPFINKIIEDIKYEVNIEKKRLINERIFLKDFLDVNSLTLSNIPIIKKTFFKIFNRINNFKTDKKYTIGLCENFSLNNKYLLKRLNNLFEKDVDIEIFCHPGRAIKNELDGKSKFIDFYTSAKRDDEKTFLKYSSFLNFKNFFK